jgi:hypothetical protein
VTGTAAVPAVLGRAAVMVTALFCGGVGVAQLAGLTVSRAIDRSNDHYLGIVWGLAFVMSATLITIARNHRDAFLAMFFELAGIVCLVGGLGIYALTLFNEADGWPKTGTMTVALCGSATVNLTGRGVLVARSLCRWLLVFRESGMGARLIRAALRCHLAARRTILAARHRIR